MCLLIFIDLNSNETEYQSETYLTIDQKQFSSSRIVNFLRWILNSVQILASRNDSLAREPEFNPIRSEFESV